MGDIEEEIEDEEIEEEEIEKEEIEEEEIENVADADEEERESGGEEGEIGTGD